MKKTSTLKNNLPTVLFTLLLSVLLPVNISAQDIAWKRNFGGKDDQWFVSVTVVPDGTVSVGRASVISFGTGDLADLTAKGSYDDAIIVKHDHAGNVVWAKNFGGNGEDWYNGVTTVADGVVAVGYSRYGSVGTGDWVGITAKGERDAIIVKYDHAGNVMWKKNFGGQATIYIIL